MADVKNFMELHPITQTKNEGIKTMNQKAVKKIKKIVRNNAAKHQQDLIDYIMAMPFLKRCQFAWKVIRNKKPKK